MLSEFLAIHLMDDAISNAILPYLVQSASISAH